MKIRPIRTDTDHAQALARMEKLWRAKAGTPSADELDLPELFMEGAPLEDLDGVADVDPLQALLPRGDGAPPVVAFARELALELENRGSDYYAGALLRKKREQKEAKSITAMEALSRGDLPPLSRDSFAMHLTCPDCGETNPYEVSEVYISPADSKAGFYVGDDLCCRSCGGTEPLEAGDRMANLGLTAELMMYSAAKDSGETYNGPLRLGITQMADGRELAPSAAVNEYRQRLAANPEHVPDLLGLGNLYRYLGPQRRAVECFERAMKLDPTVPEAAKSLAIIRLEAGDDEGAFRLLKRAVAERKHWRFHRLMEGATPADFRADFVYLYNELAERLGQETLPEPPPGPLMRRRLLHELDMGLEDFRDPLYAEPIRRGPKVRRNDPCPCGSGKKYKKCCLRRE